MKERLHKLADILINVDSYPGMSVLFLPGDEKWSAQSRCDVVSEGEEIRNGLIPSLEIHQIQDIVWNVRQQMSTASTDMLFEAFVYYYDNDAFIDLAVLSPGWKKRD